MSKVDPHLKVLEAARAGDLDEVKFWIKAGGSVQMAVMGAGDVLEVEADNNDEAKETTHKNNAKVIGQWALQNGGCLLWSFSQRRQKSKFSVLKYNKNVSMLKGPGEVTRGTFNQEAKS